MELRSSFCLGSMFVLCGDRCGDVDCGFGVDLGEIEDSWSSLPGSSSMMISGTSTSGVDAVESIFRSERGGIFKATVTQVDS